MGTLTNSTIKINATALSSKTIKFTIMTTTKIARLITLLSFLLLSTFLHAQIEERDNDVLIKTYYPSLLQISREQLIAKINDNIGNVKYVNYYAKKEGYQKAIVRFIKKLEVYDNRIQDKEGVLFYYKEIADKKIVLAYGDNISVVDIHLSEEKDIMMYRFIFKSKVFAKEFAENMYSVIQAENLVEESLSRADSIVFIDLAAKYNAMKEKPTITEEQRKYIVQANAYSKDKDLGKAIDAYKKAIAADPVAYPPAYYNMALLYAEEGYFKSAIRNMKKYILLVPDAPDARAAQDKIYEWER